MAAPAVPAADRRGEHGQALPLVALMLVVLLGFAAFAIDFGDTMLHQRRLQAAVDLAVLAGSQKLPDVAVAGDDAKTYADRNWATRDTSTITKTLSTGCMAAGCEKPDKITLAASAEVPTTFAKIFGIDKWTVRARASACGPCDTSTRKFDVMVVLDRSGSMCADSNGVYNNCYDLNQAKAAIKSLLGFFDPVNDRVGLAALSSGDSNAPFDHLGADYPCDTSSSSYSGAGRFAGSIGDFMDGTPSDHDSWVLAPLASDFKLPDGNLDSASRLVSTIDCLKSKGWTPMAPAIQAAKDELVTRGRKGPDIQQVIIYLGDGGGNAQPMVRTSAGVATTQFSWYTPSPGNNLRPCHDAVGQAAIAKAAGIDVYSIAYDLNATTAQLCFTDNLSGVPAYIESGIDARSTLQQMATDAAHYSERTGPGELTSIFNAIGRQIVLGGNRLVE